MKHKISVALLSTAFVLGLASAGFVGTRAVAQAKADDPSGVTLYLAPNSDWATSSPRYALYYYLDTTTNGWVDMPGFWVAGSGERDEVPLRAET